jgi:NADPH2 dehydrogenase
LQIFEKSNIGKVSLANKIVMPPMCMYITDNSGVANQFHFNHYGARAIGGVGLIIQEATAVNKNGRITNKDLGLWDDGDQFEVLKNLVSYVKLLNPSTKMMVQLAHAGRKVDVNSQKDFTDIIAPSSIKFNDKSLQPREMNDQDIANTKKDFIEATKRAIKAGYDGVEIHAAHGYLLHSFLSSASNKRTDNYGGNAENRVRLLKEILTEIREFFPADKILSIRISAADYYNVAESLKESIEAVHSVESLVDAIHVSSGGLTDNAPSVYPMYQLNLAKEIKQLTSKPIIAVGLINTKEEAEYVVKSGSADFVAMGRELLRNPNWVLLNNPNAKDLENMPLSYKRAF